MAMADLDPVLEVDLSESFANGLLQNMWHMKIQAEITDMTIIAANVPIPCHSGVMAAASEHVRDLLKGRMKEDTVKEIELNFDAVYVQRVVDYCYTGKISIGLSAAKPYLHIAQYFHLTELKAQIEEFLCAHVSPKTCIGWYSMAKEFSLCALETKCRVIMADKFKEVTKQMEFLQLSARELIDCIKLVEDADVALEACVSWVTSNALSRCETFLYLLKHIQLDQCSPQCVDRVLQTWKSIWPNYTEVQQALRPHASVVPRAPATPRKLTVLLFGGWTQNNELNTKLWKIDLTTETCELFTTMDHRAAKYSPGYCETPEKLFVIGGSRTVEHYQPSSDCHALSVCDSRWEAWPGVEEPLACTVAICVNDHIYTFGDIPAANAVYRLNLTTTKWTKCPDMPVGNVYPIIAALQHKVYVIFNTSPHNEQFRTSNRVSMFCFDTSTLKWTSLTPLPLSIQNTDGTEAISVGKDIYLAGGSMKLCARYSPQHDTWTMLETPQVVHRNFSAVHTDGEIVLCGGSDEHDNVHDIIEVFNVAQNSWKVHSVRMPVGVKFHHCAVYDNEARKILL